MSCVHTTAHTSVVAPPEPCEKSLRWVAMSGCQGATAARCMSKTAVRLHPKPAATARHQETVVESASSPRASPPYMHARTRCTPAVWAMAPLDGTAHALTAGRRRRLCVGTLPPPRPLQRIICPPPACLRVRHLVLLLSFHILADGLREVGVLAERAGRLDAARGERLVHGAPLGLHHQMARADVVLLAP